MTSAEAGLELLLRAEPLGKAPLLKVLTQGCCVQEKRLRRGFPEGGGLLISPGVSCVAASWFLLSGDLVFPSLPCVLLAKSHSRHRFL